MSTSLQNVALHNIELDEIGRFLVLHRHRGRIWNIQERRYEDPPAPEENRYYLHGGASPTLFKTMKMALKAVRDGNTWTKKDQATPRTGGKIVLFDVNYLPLVADDEGVFEKAGLADKLTETEFCERQIQLWADQAAKARAREKPVVVRCGVEGCRLAPGHTGLHRFGNDVP